MTIFIWVQVLGLLIALYFLGRKFLHYLGQWFFRIFKNKDTVIRAISFFLLPGTFIHEVAHLVFAEFMQVRTDGLSVVPEIKENKSIKLGGVKIEQTDPLRRTIIGLAPVFLGLILIWVASGYVFGLDEPSWPIFVVYGYLLMQVGLTMFSSPKDLEGSLIGFILFGLLSLFFKYLSEIIYFVPLSRARALLFGFLENNMWSLRNGLGLTTLLILSLVLILSLFNKPKIST